MLVLLTLPWGRSYGQRVPVGATDGSSNAWKVRAGLTPAMEASLMHRTWTETGTGTGTGTVPFLEQTAPPPQDQNSAEPQSTASQNAAPQSTGLQNGAPQNKENEKYSPSATTGSPGHIFWVEPAFKVNYSGKFQPLTPKEKFQEWAQGAYDPLGFGVTAFEAGTLEYSSKDGFCGYGHGWDGYGKCFGSLELTSTISSFTGDYLFSVLLHQDPRYFRLGKGSFGTRLFYAISRVFVTYNDSGKNVPATAQLSGTVLAGALANFYSPAKDVGAQHTVDQIALDLGNTAIFNNAAEFWPDIHQKFQQIVTSVSGKNR